MAKPEVLLLRGLSGEWGNRMVRSDGYRLLHYDMEVELGESGVSGVMALAMTLRGTRVPVAVAKSFF